MKVISGSLKGRKILGFNIDGTRPTMDRVKESLFATIQSYISNSIVLDLFSGSGNLAIESISNGAKFAYMVDNNIKCIDIINKNLRNFEISDTAEVMCCDYKKALKNFSDKGIKFNIIFLDPPYKNNDIPNIINYILDNNLLFLDAIIVCEISNCDLISQYDGLEMIKNKKYGDKYIVIYKNIGDVCE